MGHRSMTVRPGNTLAQHHPNLAAIHGLDRGCMRDALARAVGDDEVVLTRFNQLELLQGCRDEREWGLLKPYLGAQE